MNPLAKVFNALWDLFESDSNFVRLFPEGNRIKFNSATNRDPKKVNVTTADLPEIMLTCEGFQINIFNSSATTKVTATYGIVVNTGDFRMNKFINQIKWLAVCTFVNWKNVLGILTWNNKTFVRKFTVLDTQIGESNAERNRNIKGFSTIWRCQIEMYFPTSHFTFSE